MTSAKPLILTVDDDPDIQAIVAAYVRRWGYESAEVGSAAALHSFLPTQQPEVILMDVMLGDADGSELIGTIKQQYPQIPVIMITRSTSLDAAVRCMRHGATDFITKPLDFDRLRDAIAGALELHRLRSRSTAAVPTPVPAFEIAPAPESRSVAMTDEAFSGIVGRSPAMVDLFTVIDNVATTEVSVLILGETGTGKELVARAVHLRSARAAGPFVAVNAAAIPHELIESALFGHQKGAFTGALTAHCGYCEQADGGTLFLDEIGEMSFEVQAKLLRFLQDHVVQPVGSETARKVDVRVLAATNADPLAQIAERRLREDLFYRLRVVTLRLPTLAERGGDVLLLADYFLRRAADKHRRELKFLAPAARDFLLTYSWPGNVRELENTMEQAVVLYSGAELTAEMLPPEVRGEIVPAVAGGVVRRGALNELELKDRARLVAALDRHDGDLEAAAEDLGVSRATIYRRLKKYGLPGRRG